MGESYRLKLSKKMGTRQRHKRTNLGLTLTELLATLSVMAVIAAMALPAITNFVDRERLAQAAQDVYVQLLNARSESVSRAAPLFVNFNAVGNTNWVYGISQNAGCDVDVTVATAADACVVVLDDGDGVVDPGDGSVDTGDLMLRRYVAANHPNISMGIANFTSGGTEIRFDPVRGTSDAGDIRLVSPNGNQLTIRLGLLGTPRICSPDSSVVSYSDVDCT
jgi:type IV fimbrial biogenesis protein FimT